jgi:hypothetical protein
MSNQAKISQEEVSAALQRFLKKGGAIVKLPDQNYIQAHPVGEDKYEIYESITDLSLLANSAEQGN